MATDISSFGILELRGGGTVSVSDRVRCRTRIWRVSLPHSQRRELWSSWFQITDKLPVGLRRRPSGGVRIILSTSPFESSIEVALQESFLTACRPTKTSSLGLRRSYPELVGGGLGQLLENLPVSVTLFWLRHEIGNVWKELERLSLSRWSGPSGGEHGSSDVGVGSMGHCSACGRNLGAAQSGEGRHAQ